MRAVQVYRPTLSVSSSENFLSLPLQVIGASLLLGLFAQIRIPLFFSPVPITGQTLGIMLIGALLGSRMGALSVLLYLVEGCLGLPLFTSGKFGVLHLIGPTGGYCLGFVVQAFIAGWFIERTRGVNAFRTASALLMSSFVQMGFGVLWLSQFVGWNHVMTMGFYPFIPGEILKVVLIVGFLQLRMQQRSNNHS